MVVLVACNSPVIKPPEGPGTEYPCGVHGKSCGDHMCCGEYDVCGSTGAFSRCPEGYCCYDGPPNWPGVGAAYPDAGAKKMRAQWAEGKSK